MSETTWEDLRQQATSSLAKRDLPDKYSKRLKFEFAEIDKQGANAYWLGLFAEKKRFTSNPNGLLLPWLLGMVDEDPLNGQDPFCSTQYSKVTEYQDQNGSLPKGIIKDADVPDTDLDCLPAARDHIKAYAAEQYGRGINDGYGTVCSVGTWTTYLFKSAIADVAKALGAADKSEVYQLTTTLPDDVDQLKDGGVSVCKGKRPDPETGEDVDCGTSHGEVKCPNCGCEETENPTIGQLLKEYDQLRDFARKYPQVIGKAKDLVGRVKSMGMHAGALIITNRPLYGNIPMAKKSQDGYWVSMWTEGRNTQLSRFGYNKWDILGLKTLKYIFTCCQLIERNRGISFGNPVEGVLETEDGETAFSGMSGWDDIDPTQNRAGHFFDGDGNKRYISLDDEYALRLADDQKTDGIFQFDTDLAKSILANGVRNFGDLLLFNAMGHPGPMQSIPEAVENRDDLTSSWKKNLHPDILPILEDTYGVICWQEQLQQIWQVIAGFTAPEAQDARKAVAKKWVHKLKPIEQKWLDGASKRIGREEAEQWWSKMVTFGRYAFNKSHGVSYCLVAHRCLWLKAHFAPEYWAAVMSDCHPDKLVRYMGVARSEDWEPTEITYCGKYVPEQRSKGVGFGTLNIDHLTNNFGVTGDTVNQGLIGIKKIGDNTADVFAGKGSFADIDQFVAEKGKNKTVMERFIKLGAFSHLPGHGNSKALWQWYLYKYCTGKDVTALRKDVRKRLLAKDGWTDEKIKEERDRQITAYRKQYPKRTKIPSKILNWTPKPVDSRDNVLSLFDGDFTIAEQLEFEKEFLGYTLHSPLELFESAGGLNIAKGKEAARAGEDYRLEVIIVDQYFGLTKNQSEYLRLTVTDGVQTTPVFIWSNDLFMQDENNLVEGVGVSMAVDFDERRGSFSLRRGDRISKLLPKS